jgi:hypothetical protein
MRSRRSFDKAPSSANVGGQYVGLEAIVDGVGPMLRRVGPCSVVSEARRVDRGFGPSEPVELALADTDRPTAVHADLEQPRAQRGSAFEAFDPANQRHPRFLDDVLGRFSAVHELPCQGHQPTVVAIDQLDERELLAGSQALDQLCVGAHRADPSRRTFCNALGPTED